MAFRALTCPSCGANIQLDDEKAVGFCNYCGEQILLKDIVEVRHVGLDPRERRESALDELYAIYNYLDLRAEKEAIYNQAARKEKYTRLKSTRDYYVSGGIFIGLVFIFIAIAFEIPNKIAGVVMLLIMLGVAFLIWYLVIKPAPEKGAQNMARKQQLHAETIDAQNELNAVKFVYDKPTLSTQYYSLPVVSALISNIESGRADTIKESINVFNDDNYKAEMKQIAVDTQKAMEASARAAEQAARAARRR